MHIESLFLHYQRHVAQLTRMPQNIHHLKIVTRAQREACVSKSYKKKRESPPSKRQVLYRSRKKHAQAPTSKASEGCLRMVKCMLPSRGRSEEIGLGRQEDDDVFECVGEESRGEEERRGEEGDDFTGEVIFLSFFGAFSFFDFYSIQQQLSRSDKLWEITQVPPNPFLGIRHDLFFFSPQFLINCPHGCSSHIKPILYGKKKVKI